MNVQEMKEHETDMVIQKLPLKHKKAEKKRVAAYVRVSSGKESMLHSQFAQISYYNEYIKVRPMWEFAGIYVDEATTGTKDNREKFNLLIQDCESGKIDMVIVKSISRFARNTLTLLKTVRHLKELSIDVYFEEQNIHTIGYSGELLITLLAAFAQAESFSVSENCKWRIRQKFENGEIVGLSCMYGYVMENNTITIQKEQAKVIKKIFEWYLNGESAAAIAKKLNDLKIRPLRTDSWAHNRIILILKNEKYTGNSLLQKSYVTNHISKEKVKNKGEKTMYYAENTHPAIISQETFDKAQEILKKRSERVNIKHSTNSKYPFSGLIECKHCGSKYRRITTNKTHKWNCDTYLHQGKQYCHAKAIPEDILYRVTNEVLHLDNFDEKIFHQKIKKIVVPEFNTLEFVFKDGSVTKKVWKDKSRKDSWTDEMKEKARQKRFERRKNNA